MAIEIHTKALQITLTNDSIIYEVLYDRALANSKIGNFSNAVDDCTKILEKNPTEKNALLLRARCFDFLDQYEKGIQDYKVALCVTEDKENAEVRSELEKIVVTMQHKLAEEKNDMGKFNCESKNYRLAQQNYTEAIELWPNNLRFYRNRCKTNFIVGEYERASNDSEYIVSIDSKDVIGLTLMARCSLILGYYYSAEDAINSLVENNYDEKECNNLKDLWATLKNCKSRAYQNFHQKKYLDAGILSNHSICTSLN